MENHALDIIDMLYNMIAEAWGVPLGNDKSIVERDKALNLLDDLKATLPMELSEARRLVNARDEFVANAKQEADNIRRGAEDKATQMIDEQNVYKEARRRSDEIVQTAEAKSRELLRAANSYLDDALRAQLGHRPLADAQANPQLRRQRPVAGQRRPRRIVACGEPLPHDVRHLLPGVPGCCTLQCLSPYGCRILYRCIEFTISSIVADVKWCGDACSLGSGGYISRLSRLGYVGVVAPLSGDGCLRV